MNCINCGEVLTPGSVSCPKCGTVVGGQPVVQPVVQQPVVQPTVQQPQVMPVQQPMVQPVMEPVQQPVQPVMQQPIQPVVQQPEVEQLVVEQPVVSPQPIEMSVQPEMVQPMMQQPQVALEQPAMQQPMMMAGMPQPSPVPVQQQPAPQPAVGGIVPSQQPVGKKSKKGLIIIILIILALGLAVGGYFIYDSIQDNKTEEKQKDKENKTEKEDKDEDDDKETIDDLSELVSVEEYHRFSDGSIILLVENKSSRVVGVDVEIEYYDMDEKTLGASTEYTSVAPRSKRYIRVSEYSVKEGYATTKMNVSTTDYTAIMEMKNLAESEITINELENEYVIQYKNDTQYSMDMEVFAMFYLKGSLVYVLDSYTSDVSAGNNANLSLNKYNLEGIMYDDYEIIGYAEYDTYGD